MHVHCTTLLLLNGQRLKWWLTANTGWCSGLAHHRNLLCYYRPSVGFPGWLTGAWRPRQACLVLLTISPFLGTQEGSHHCCSNWLCMLLSTVTGWRRWTLKHAIKMRPWRHLLPSSTRVVLLQVLNERRCLCLLPARNMAPHLARAADGVSERVVPQCLHYVAICIFRPALHMKAFSDLSKLMTIEMKQ